MTASEIAEETVLRRSPEAVEGDLPEESVLLHVSKGVALRINATAAWLWAQIAEPASVGDVAERLAAHAGIERERAVADVTSFAADLASRGFLELG